MATRRETMLAALRGDEAGRLQYVPRLDLWWLANSVSGTLPARYAGRAQNEIARAEGWNLYFRFADDILDPETQRMYAHRGIGLFATRDVVWDYVLPPDVDIAVTRDGGRIRVEYRTPVGTLDTTMFYDRSSQRLGVTSPMIVDHLIKTPDDYAAACYLFERIDLVPNHSRFERWVREELREDGVAVAQGMMGASPVHQIQRDFLDPTQFYFHYKDHYAKLRGLADRMEPLFDKALAIVCDSPADVVWWGANYDDMLTYPPYFERELSPWLRKASRALGERGKLLLSHCDGENEGLMELIPGSGMHIAESICPAPMTRVSLAEYYRRWSGRLTLWGGVPSTVVLPETSDADFEGYLDRLFEAVAPGGRYLVGIADQVPPNAIFSRLQRIGERVEREGELPLKAGAARPIGGAELARAGARATPAAGAESREGPDADDAIYADVRAAVAKGRHVAVKDLVADLLARGVPAADILDRGLIASIDAVGKRMAAGQAFIPEVLLAARAMAAAIGVLEPSLAAGGAARRGRIVIGTVTGDMHDIGKNLVVTMMKGVGYDVIDLGVNVARESFCAAVAEHRPDFLGLSALLTTTMMEMREVIRALDERGLRAGCKVIVGGAPVSEAFARQIGADGFAPDAVAAVALANRLMSGATAEA